MWRVPSSASLFILQNDFFFLPNLIVQCTLYNIHTYVCILCIVYTVLHSAVWNNLVACAQLCFIIHFTKRFLFSPTLIVECTMYIIQYTIYSTYICMYTLYSVYCITFCCLEQPWMLKISLNYYIISKIYIPCYRYFTITALSDYSEFLLRIIISYLLYDNRF